MLTGCDRDTGTIPTPGPQTPNMIGGWQGILSTVWTGTDGQGSSACDETWVIDGQGGGHFQGSFQWSGQCNVSGRMGGTITPNGNIRIPSVSYFGDCIVTGGDAGHDGFVSPSGRLTTQAIYSVRCVTNRGVVDRQASTTRTLTKR